ncbi:MAG: hypothetical protein FVQ78_08350 [Solirubrobacterales bacterium]|nr:hypothetical protein [Solirubrobacterales bacterium]
MADDTRLYRRVPPRVGDGWVRDENNDCLRLSSAVFQGNEMSIFLADTMEAEGRSALDALDGHSDFFLVSITAGVACSQGQQVRRSPIEEEPAHGDVVGKKNRKLRQALRDSAEWIKAPDGLCPYEKVAAA